MAGRKALDPISPKQTTEMLDFSKKPSKPDVVLQKKDDMIPKHTLHINAKSFAEAEKRTIKRNIRPIPTTAFAILENESAEAKATNTETNPSFGGYKKGKANAKDKYTVKELKAIASRNNIKTTKKLDGKTVNLNKKGLMAKLKRKKLI